MVFEKKARFFFSNYWDLLQARLSGRPRGTPASESAPGGSSGEAGELPEVGPAATPVGLYLDLMKRVLSNVIYSRVVPEKFDNRWRDQIRLQGGAWPRMAHTMIGFKRLTNLQFCVEDVIEKGVPGDLIETGVWRGAACIFMRAILKAHGVRDRRVRGWPILSRACPRPTPTNTLPTLDSDCTSRKRWQCPWKKSERTSRNTAWWMSRCGF